MSREKPTRVGQDREVSEGGSAFTDSETELGGADAVPDKTTGSALGRDDEGAEQAPEGGS